MKVLLEPARRLAAAALLSNALAAGASVALKPPNGNMQLTSTAFQNGRPIPEQYTCDGKNISPPLKWSGAPSGTKSFVLICDDPDAPSGDWTHWMVYDLPAAATELPEAAPKFQYIAGNAKQGLNDFRQLGYGGPCPPPGKPHRYFFRLAALDAMLGIQPGASKKDVQEAMAKHVLAQTELMGTYQRK